MSHLSTGSWVTDGGLETDLLFNHGVDLPEFASFPLVRMSRLSVMPVTDAQWTRIEKMSAGAKGSGGQTA